MNNDQISFSSGVSAKSGKPFVHMEWGKNKGQFTPEELREHAMGLLEAAMAAEIDAFIMAWAIAKLKVPKENAAHLLLLFRQKRETGKIPSVTVNIDGEHMRPDTIKQASRDMLYMAFSAEMEAFLASMIVEDVGLSGEVADQMIQEMREMRGALTMWPEEQADKM